MENFWTEVLQLAETTTKRVGSQLIADFGKLQATKKEDGSLVTKADRWADEEITQAITATFKDHGVLGEETSHIFPANDWCWIIDPIDGTTNFTRGVPIWGISLGLLYRGTPVFGYVYLPLLNHSYYGYWLENSGLIGPVGAYLNGEPIHTSTDAPSKSHLFNLCARSIDVLKQPFPCKIRMIGVASYNILLVAVGAALGGVEATPKIWDIAAVWVILQAAGGAFIALDKTEIFPLTVGQNYGKNSFPCLVVSREELVPVFKPLVEFLANSN
ncbi:inositol monophosphatase family protein [Gloeothece verrucosa]|uniref:inositol-phosphate phosphatase n=1 Tax=Gloeothece verrucosa (strain PCC 7822) TaxID=497965 RepID=E0U5L4_GLOV7|nr:inositol monophosphatase family protein [Gloeothece verrucosa]ADN14727.1 inositol monophosphatase [Gloeothece verrucosa PCC 7822]